MMIMVVVISIMESSAFSSSRSVSSSIIIILIIAFPDMDDCHCSSEDRAIQLWDWIGHAILQTNAFIIFLINFKILIFCVINILTIMVSPMFLDIFLFLSKLQTLQSWISYLSPEMLTLVTKIPVKDLSCLIFPMWVYLWGCFLFAKNHSTPVIPCLNVGWFYTSSSLRRHIFLIYIWVWI